MSKQRRPFGRYGRDQVFTLPDERLEEDEFRKSDLIVPNPTHDEAERAQKNYLLSLRSGGVEMRANEQFGSATLEDGMALFGKDVRTGRDLGVALIPGNVQRVRLNGRGYEAMDGLDRSFYAVNDSLESMDEVISRSRKKVADVAKERQKDVNCEIFDKALKTVDGANWGFENGKTTRIFTLDPSEFDIPFSIIGGVSWLGRRNCNRAFYDYLLIREAWWSRVASTASEKVYEHFMEVDEHGKRRVQGLFGEDFECEAKLFDACCKFSIEFDRYQSTQQQNQHLLAFRFIVEGL